MLMLVLTLIANPKTHSLKESIAIDIGDQVGGEAPHWLAPDCACDIVFSGAADQQQIRKAVLDKIGNAPVDWVVQPVEGRRKRALIADMDSTMIEQECIDELADEVGVKDQVSEITARTMNGELDFESSVDMRVALLKGLDATVAERIIAKRITFAAGGKTLVSTMKANGAYTALVSGGFTSFTMPIAGMLGFHENRANVLEEAEGKLSGTVQKPILGADAKVTALNEIARQKRLYPEDFIAVGDGANDIPMLQTAGTGVALHAKPFVAAQSEITINHGDLTALLYIQGYAESEFVHE